MKLHFRQRESSAGGSPRRRLRSWTALGSVFAVAAVTVVAGAVSAPAAYAGNAVPLPFCDGQQCTYTFTQSTTFTTWDLKALPRGAGYSIRAVGGTGGKTDSGSGGAGVGVQQDFEGDFASYRVVIGGNGGDANGPVGGSGGSGGGPGGGGAGGSGGSGFNEAGGGGGGGATGVYRSTRALYDVPAASSDRLVLLGAGGGGAAKQADGGASEQPGTTAKDSGCSAPAGTASGGGVPGSGCVGGAGNGTAAAGGAGGSFKAPHGPANLILNNRSYLGGGGGGGGALGGAGGAIADSGSNEFTSLASGGGGGASVGSVRGGNNNGSGRVELFFQQPPINATLTVTPRSAALSTAVPATFDIKLTSQPAVDPRSQASKRVGLRVDGNDVGQVDLDDQSWSASMTLNPGTLSPGLHQVQAYWPQGEHNWIADSTEYIISPWGSWGSVFMDRVGDSAPVSVKVGDKATVAPLNVPNKLLTVHGNSTADGAVVDAWQRTLAGGSVQGNQQWQYFAEPAAPGYGYLRNVTSGKCLQRNGTTYAVDQWTCVQGAPNHLWRVAANAGGGLSMQLKQNGQYLAVSGPFAMDGTSWSLSDVQSAYTALTLAVPDNSTVQDSASPVIADNLKMAIAQSTTGRALQETDRSRDGQVQFLPISAGISTIDPSGQWTYDLPDLTSQYGQLVNAKTGRCLAYSDSTFDVVAAACDASSANQNWRVVPSLKGGLALQVKSNSGYLMFKATYWDVWNVDTSSGQNNETDLVAYRL